MARKRKTARDELKHRQKKPTMTRKPSAVTRTHARAATNNLTITQELHHAGDSGTLKHRNAARSQQ